jgi:acyl-CoA thioester hydrolase
MGLVTRREVEIRWRDMDAFRHVNNAVFLTYLEAARDDFLGRLCGDGQGLWSFVIRRVELDFVSQLTQDDGAVVAEVRLERVGSSSLVTRERLTARSDGRLAAEAVAVLVHLDETRLRSAPMPDDLRARILANDAAGES